MMHSEKPKNTYWKLINILIFFCCSFFLLNFYNTVNQNDGSKQTLHDNVQIAAWCEDVPITQNFVLESQTVYNVITWFQDQYLDNSYELERFNAYYQGNLIIDRTQTLAAAGILPNSTLTISYEFLFHVKLDQEYELHFDTYRDWNDTFEMLLLRNEFLPDDFKEYEFFLNADKINFNDLVRDLPFTDGMLITSTYISAIDVPWSAIILWSILGVGILIAIIIFFHHRTKEDQADFKEYLIE